MGSIYRAFLPALPSQLDDQYLWQIMALLEPATEAEEGEEELEGAKMPEGVGVPPTEAQMEERVHRYLSRNPAALANLNAQRAKQDLPPMVLDKVRTP